MSDVHGAPAADEPWGELITVSLAASKRPTTSASAAAQVTARLWQRRRRPTEEGGALPLRRRRGHGRSCTEELMPALAMASMDNAGQVNSVFLPGLTVTYRVQRIRGWCRCNTSLLSLPPHHLLSPGVTTGTEQVNSISTLVSTGFQTTQTYIINPLPCLLAVAHTKLNTLA